MSDSEDEANNYHNQGIENGHVSPIYPFFNSSDDTESGDDEPTDAARTDRFDPDLPTTHKYLGKLNDVSGYTLYDENEIVTMLGIHTNTLVFPGFTLPLMMSNRYENSIMQNFIEKQNVFVLLCGDETLTKVFEYGVTMEIFETYVRNGSICLKARGRQRCRIVRGLDSPPGGRLQNVTVKILGEPPILSPLCDTQYLTLKARRSIICNSYSDMVKNYKYRRYHLSQYPLPDWLYDRYEVCFLVKHVLDGLSAYYVKEYIPQDPVKLSYWFIQNFQLQHSERLKILKLNSAVERLRLELSYLHTKRLLVCDHCNAEITEQRHVFAMSKDGVQSNYCNPGGYVYETVTVMEAKNFTLVGNPSKQFSWFPGYAWTIMQCNNCNVHLGWMFTSKHLRPNRFYGLAKSGFKVLIVSDYAQGAPTGAIESQTEDRRWVQPVNDLEV